MSLDRTALYASVAKGMVEFGYPDVTPEMVAEIVASIEAGDAEQPHGIVGSMIASMWGAP